MVELFKVVCEDFKIKVEVNFWILFIILVLSVAVHFIIKAYRKKRLPTLNLMEIEADIGGHKCKFKVIRNAENLYIANRIYIELITRKAAIEIDPDCDIIVEIYDSWYKLFGTIRDEIKGVPGEYLENKNNSSDALIQLTVKILNEGLRPHLTKYQAEYRKWFEKAQKEKLDVPPHEVQKCFCKYDELMKDIQNVNLVLFNYAEELKKFIYG